MKYLLDTHILIWWLQDSPRLSSNFSEIIENEMNIKYVSVASIWEIVIKVTSGKLNMGKSVNFIISKLFEFKMLDINLKHVLEIANLPSFHKDPFDRIMTAQAKVEGLIFLTADRKIMKYFRS